MRLPQTGGTFTQTSTQVQAPGLLTEEIEHATSILLTFDQGMLDDGVLVDPSNYTINSFPRLLSATFVDMSTITLLFSELLDTTTAQDETNYGLTGASAPVVSTASLGEDGVTVTLVLATELTDSETYDVTASGVLDLTGNEVDPAYDTVSFLAQFPEFVWTQLSPATSPSARQEHKMVYCNSTHTGILFGGYVGGDETWSWNGSTWTNKAPGTKPSERYEHDMAYDSVNDVVVLYGGIASPRSDQTWHYAPQANTWTLITPTGAPGALESHAMVYDSSRDEIVLFGGYSTNNKTWIYKTTTQTWTEKATGAVTKPGARYYHRMAYDSVRHVTVLFGGSSGNSETWEWDGSVWAQKVPATTTPAGRSQQAMFYSQAAGGVVMYGGDGADPTIWVWDGSDWTQSVPDSPPVARYGHTMTFDYTTSGLIVFGGYNAITYDLLDDTWTYAP